MFSIMTDLALSFEQKLVEELCVITAGPIINNVTNNSLIFEEKKTPKIFLKKKKIKNL